MFRARETCRESTLFLLTLAQYASSSLPMTDVDRLVAYILCTLTDLINRKIKIAILDVCKSEQEL